MTKGKSLQKYLNLEENHRATFFVQDTQENKAAFFLHQEGAISIVCWKWSHLGRFSFTLLSPHAHKTKRNQQPCRLHLRHVCECFLSLNLVGFMVTSCAVCFWKTNTRHNFKSEKCVVNHSLLIRILILGVTIFIPNYFSPCSVFQL